VKIGQSVAVKGVDRYTCVKGYPYEFNPPQDIIGIITQRALFLELRVLVEFEVKHAKYQIWKYASDVVPLEESNDVRKVR
jgi:hypothetical protein